MPRLAQLVREKFPGAYDDMDDATLEAAIQKMHPGVYDDLLEPTKADMKNMGGGELLDMFMRDPGPMGSAVRGAQSGGIMSIGPQAVDKGRQLITGLAKRMYQGALKPSKTLVAKTPGGADALAETGLREGLTVSKGGLQKASDTIGAIDDQVTDALASSSATVSRKAVAKRLQDPYGQFKNQVNPEADLEQIRNVGRGFKRSQPTQIRVQDAQKIKQGTYRAQDKKYGQIAGATAEAEKALARGLKEEISTAVPTVAPLNARSSQLIKVKKALEDATRRTGNRDTIGLTDIVAGGTNPKLLAATVAMRAVPQSIGARVINRTGQAGPTPDALAAAVRALLLGQDE